MITMASDVDSRPRSFSEAYRAAAVAARTFDSGGRGMSGQASELLDKFRKVPEAGKARLDAGFVLYCRRLTLANVLWMAGFAPEDEELANPDSALHRSLFDIVGAQPESEFVVCPEARPGSESWSIDFNRRRYAKGVLNRSSLVSSDGSAGNHGLDEYVCGAYDTCREDMDADRAYFRVVDGALCSRDGRTRYLIPDGSHFVVTDDFYRFLASLGRWDFAKGKFDTVMGDMLAWGK